MRGCLTVLIAGVAFLAILAWFAAPPLAGAVVATGLAASGLSGTGTTVAVTASPPYELLELHADAVDIHSTNVSWRGIAASTLDLRLGGLDLGARTADSVSGHLEGVSVPIAGGTASVERMDLAGPSSAVGVVMTVEAGTASRLATHAVETAIGKTPTSVQLLAPDRVIVTVDGQQVQGNLTVDPNGAIIVTIPPFGRAVVADPSTEVPVVIDSVSVVPGGVVTLGGTLDPRALGLSR